MACGYLHDGDCPPDSCPVCGAHKYQFILDEPLPQTLEKRLKEAFAGDSKANMRNLAFGKKAEEEGFPQVARLFRAVAEAERVHAEEYRKYLEGSHRRTRRESQGRPSKTRFKAKKESHPAFVKEAFELKRGDVALILPVPGMWRRDTPNSTRDALGSHAPKQDTEYHVCQVCGYIFDGELSEQCPVCRTKRENFKKVG